MFGGLLNLNKKKGGTKKSPKKQQRASIQQEVVDDGGPTKDCGVSRMQPTTAVAPTTAAPPSAAPAAPTSAVANVAVAQCAKNAKEEVKKWAARALDKGINGLREEFGELKRYCPPDMSITTFQAHWEAGRNRYKDVPCQDKCRIILKWPGQQHDYIHAK
uniref:Tyrosine-protein phosphatase domain-containing protein n=1 Tax=Panagrolaimus davidi TaxID=227884 RepID=A0A914PTZ7_9BILA